LPDRTRTPFLALAELAEAGQPLDDPRPVSAESLALIWHTGGTTGTPKACYHQAGPFLAGGHAAGQAFGFTPDEVQLAFPGPSATPPASSAGPSSASSTACLTSRWPTSPMPRRSSTPSPATGSPGPTPSPRPAPGCCG